MSTFIFCVLHRNDGFSIVAVIAESALRATEILSGRTTYHFSLEREIPASAEEQVIDIMEYEE